MLDRDKIKYVIDEIIKKDYNYPLACKVLDVFAERAETIQDYDVLGEMSILAKYYDLRLRAAHFTYTHSSSPENLFKTRENLYKIYNSLNEPEKALFYVELNLKQKPNHVETLMNKAFNLSLMNKKQEAEKILEGIITDDPKLKESLEYALSGKQLRIGDTARGIRNFITKFKPKNLLFEENLKLKFWDGGIYPGKTIVINGEGGVGDELINIRFLDWFKKNGMNPILYSSWHMYRPDLSDVFRRNGHQVVSNHIFFKLIFYYIHISTINNLVVLI